MSNLRDILASGQMLPILGGSRSGASHSCMVPFIKQMQEWAFRAGYLPGKPEISKNLFLNTLVTASAPKDHIVIHAGDVISAPPNVVIGMDPADERGSYAVRVTYEYRCAEKEGEGARNLCILNVEDLPNE